MFAKSEERNELDESPGSRVLHDLGHGIESLIDGAARRRMIQ